MPTSYSSKRPIPDLPCPAILLAGLLSIIPIILNGQNPSPNRLHLIFTGDIMGHEPQILAAEQEKNKKYDFSPCFEFVAPLLQQADLAIGNLELTLPGKPPYTGYPLFKSPEGLATDLRLAGFDVLTTANNHSNDSGPDGLRSTLDILDKNGFYHTGTFRDSSEYQAFYPLIIYKKNFKIALLNYTYGTNGLRTKAPAIVNLIDEDAIANDLEMARRLNPDFTIVSIHWGDEYQTAENQQQRNLAAKIASWGADLIIGAHPHIVQPVREVSDPENQRKVWTGYSLGNFISGQRRPETDGGMILEVWLEKDPDSGITRLADLQYISTWVWVETTRSGKKIFRILPASAFEGNTPGIDFPEYAQNALRKHAANLRKRLTIRERLVPLSEIKTLGIEHSK